MSSVNFKGLMIAVCSLVVLTVFAACASNPAVSAAPASEPADITRTMGQLNVSAGDTVTLPLDGRLVQIGNQGLPPSFGPDTLVFNVAHQYWLDGGEQTVGTYQLIMSGVIPSQEMQTVSGSTLLEQGTTIGVAASSPVMVNLRCRSFDLYLCDTSTTPPEQINGWYYFGVGMLMSSTPKFLDYQPITGAADEIQFWDYPETLAQMSQDGYNSYVSKRQGDVVSNYPGFWISFETAFDRYPSNDLHFSTPVSPANRLLINRTYQNCPVYLSMDFDGIPMQLLFQQGFDQYLKEEYTLGDPIWLYLQVNMFVNGELIGYVRDYTLVPPVEHAVTRQNRIREYIEELDAGK